MDEGLNVQPVNADNPVRRFEVNRTSIWSKFPDFAMQNEVRSNNYGFINNQDYYPRDTSPLVAVIGDSYVEAVMVPYKNTMHGLLAKKLARRTRVYSFASSGTPLSGYLAYAEYARRIFHPDKMIFVVVGNDFDESLARYKTLPGDSYFFEDPDGKLVLRRIDRAPSLIIRTLRMSSVVRYLFLNCRLEQHVGRLKAWLTRGGGSKSPAPKYVGNTAFDPNQERIEYSRKAVDAFLRLVGKKSGLSPENILFVIDGARSAIYDESLREQATQSFFWRMRTYLKESARGAGFEVVDMHELFLEDYRRHGQKFEFPRDGHWNEHGHRLVFEGVFNSGFLKEYRQDASRQGHKDQPARTPPQTR